MKTRNTLARLVITMAVAVLAAGLVKAQGTDGSVKFISYASIGIVHGERVRLSVANNASGSSTLSFQYYLAHGTNASNRVPFYESESMRMAPGEFRFSGVSRENLNTEGEAGTGRAQMIVKVTIIAPAGSNPDDFPGSLEVFADGSQGVQTDSKYRLIYVAAKRAQVNAPIGFLPGHRLSYSLFYPNEEGSQPVRVTAYVYDSYGNLLRQTDPVALQPGQFHTLAFNYEDLGVAGVVPVRASIQVVLMDGSVRPMKLPVSFELVNNGTGRTVAGGGPYSTGYVKVSDDGE